MLASNPTNQYSKPKAVDVITVIVTLNKMRFIERLDVMTTIINATNSEAISDDVRIIRVVNLIGVTLSTRSNNRERKRDSGNINKPKYKAFRTAPVSEIKAISNEPNI